MQTEAVKGKINDQLEINDVIITKINEELLHLKDLLRIPEIKLTEKNIDMSLQRYIRGSQNPEWDKEIMSELNQIYRKRFS